MYSFSLQSQDFINRSYGVQKPLTQLVYGVSSNYLNQPDTLKLDIYKPSGNRSVSRPLLVLIHGGAWIGGDKSESGIVQIAYEFVKRGYVVASVNYRLGTHKANWAMTPVQKDVNAGFHAAYISDSAEVYRAWFRAIQDVKGAIRFMKARQQLDSTCANAVFVGGESAGGYNALGVAFLDRSAEKPAACFEIADVPMPQSNLLDNYPGGKVTSQQLKRPDLGPVEGTLNLNGHHTRIRGVINFFGGMMAEAISNQWMQGNDSIRVYMTHQTCDGIVPCHTAICLSPLSIHCNLGYTPFHTRWPLSYGSCALKSGFSAGNNKLLSVKSETFTCDPISIPLTDCIRYAQNGSYHWTVNWPVRCDTISRYFASTVVNSLQNCATSNANTQTMESSIRLYPNPSQGSFYLQTRDRELYQAELYNTLGQRIEYQKAEDGLISFDPSASGAVLFVRVHTAKGVVTGKVLVIR